VTGRPFSAREGRGRPQVYVDADAARAAAAWQTFVKASATVAPRMTREAAERWRVALRAHGDALVEHGRQNVKDEAALPRALAGQRGMLGVPDVPQKRK
jgi:hypothetical protein